MAAGDGAWLGRLDALADRLAGLDDRAAMIDQLVTETMQLLPTDEVRVYADAATVTAPSFTDENESSPARGVIPLAIAGRHFGAIEIAMKPGQALGPGERALIVALARQCALAIDSWLSRQAVVRASVELAPVVVESPVAAPVPAVVVAPAAPVSPGLDLSAMRGTLAHLENDVRALAKLARLAELPPAAWVDRAETTALRRLDEAKAQLVGRVENAA